MSKSLFDVDEEVDPVRAFFVLALTLVILVSVQLFIIGFINWIWPNAVPLGIFQFWETKGSLLDWCASSWAVLLWGFGASLVLSIIHEANRHTQMERLFGISSPRAGKVFRNGLVLSVVAGIFEEIQFRWLGFLLAIIGVRFVDFLIFGWAGFGLVHWFNDVLTAPLANWTTFGHLSSVLYSPLGWFIGAAMLASNAKFRDGHKYQGPLGIVNSWFIGMFFFWLMFTYGLVSAIVIHTIYDVGCFTAKAIVRWFHQ